MRAAIRGGDAPTFGALAEMGEAIWDGVSVFPSITPAATAAIVTGEPPVGSGIYGHAWYDKAEGRIVIYGAMTETVITSGPLQVLHNNVWRMNRDDLYADTLFERLYEIGVEGACVNYPIRRGPYRHQLRLRTLKGVAKVGAALLAKKAEPFTLIYFFEGDSLAHHEGIAAQRRYMGTLDGYVKEILE